MLVTSTRLQKYIIIILILDLSVRACVHPDPSVRTSGIHLTGAKKFLFLGTAGLERYDRESTDMASNGPSHN